MHLPNMATAPPFTFLIWQPGEIAGIVIGSVIGAAILIALVVYFVKKNEDESDLPK